MERGEGEFVTWRIVGMASRAHLNVLQRRVDFECAFEFCVLVKFGMFQISRSQPDGACLDVFVFEIRIFSSLNLVRFNPAKKTLNHLSNSRGLLGLE